MSYGRYLQLLIWASLSLVVTFAAGYITCAALVAQARVHEGIAQATPAPSHQPDWCGSAAIYHADIHISESECKEICKRRELSSKVKEAIQKEKGKWK